MKLTDHKKDRLCYILEELFNYLITILVTGSYLAKITSYLGFSDSLTAILSSFVTLGCSSQMLSGLVFRKGMIKPPRKAADDNDIVILHITHRSFL